MARPMPSAAYRIAFTYAAAFAVAVLMLGIAVYFAADAQFRQQRDDSLIKESTELARTAEHRTLFLAELAQRGAINYGNGRVYGLFDGSGRQIAGMPFRARPKAGLGNTIFIDPVDGNDPARASVVDLRNGDRLVVAQDSEVIEAIDKTILGLFAIAFAVILVVGIVGALLLGGYLQRRLETISSTAQAIVEGSFGERVPIGPRKDEFDRVGIAVNAMLDRIVKLMENLRQVSSDIAHDLRTPLLRLQNQLEQAGSREGAIEKAQEQAEALLGLFGSILRIAEVEGGSLVASFVDVDLSALMLDVCESYDPAYQDSHRTLVWTIAPGIAVLGNRLLLTQALANLLDNGQVHTPRDTTVHVVLASGDGVATLTVADNGPGIPGSDRNRMLLRFVRGEASRTTPGAGLGLSLVAAVVDTHGGTVTLDDGKPGLVVCLRMPLKVD